MCAEFAVLTISGTKAGCLVSCGHCTISKWSDRMGCDVKVVHHDEWCMYNKFHAYCTFLVVMAAC